MRKYILGAAVAMCGLLAAVSSKTFAQDSYLFEKNGFRIHYVGNGGNCAGCEWIAVDGEIPSEAGQLFEDYTNEHKLNNIRLDVTLNSSGGSLLGGIRLGRVIRRLGMQTSAVT
jgi:hypothetical protein